MLGRVCGLVKCLLSLKSPKTMKSGWGDRKRVSCHRNQFLYSRRCVACRTISLLRPRLYGEKLSRARGSPPSRVNFSERLYEKNVDPFVRVKSWLSNDNRARACSDRLVLIELTRLGGPKCLYGEKLARL